MITKITLGQTEDVTLCQFGTGDIMFNHIESAEFKYALAFHQTPPREIGSTTTEFIGKTTDELKEMGIPPRVVLHFTRPESITALIHSLVEVQKKMFPATPEDQLDTSYKKAVGSEQPDAKPQD